MNTTAILEAFLGRTSIEGMDMPHMLFARRLKSDAYVKRFVKGVRTLMEIGWLQRLELLEAQGVRKWNVTHIMSIALPYTERVIELVESTTRSQKLVGKYNIVYEH